MSWWLINVIVGVVPLWGDCPMRLSHSGIVPSLRLSHSWYCLLWAAWVCLCHTRGTFAVVCVLVDVGVHLDTFVGGPRRPPFKWKILWRTLLFSFHHGSPWGKSFSDVYMCIHRTIGGFMNVVCVLFFFFFSWLFSCLSTVFRFILAWFLFMWLCLSRLLIILVDSTYGPTWLPPDDMRIPDWNQTRMRRSQWKSSTLVCFVVFIFANTRRVVCVIKISAIRLGLGLGLLG